MPLRISLRKTIQHIECFIEVPVLYIIGRGLSAQEARQLMVTALLQPVIDRFSPDLREKVRSELEGRLSHE